MRKKILIGFALIIVSLFIVNVTVSAAKAQSYSKATNGNNQKNMMGMIGNIGDHTNRPNFVDGKYAGMMGMHSNFTMQDIEHCSGQNSVS